MVRSVYIRVMLIMAAVSATECFGLSLVGNGGFEADAKTLGIANIRTKAPQFWDVNVPSKFGGTVSTYWRPKGLYTLTIFSNQSTVFTAGEKAFVSQRVDLTDVNEIIFDVKLLSYKYGEGAWDSTKCTAFVKIDGNDVWQSGAGATGASYDVTVDVRPYKNSMPHTLSIGIRANATGTFSLSYQAAWDFVKFDAFCGGFGYLEADFNHDCSVDMLDLQMMASDWMAADMPAAYYPIDMATDGKIDLADFAVLAGQWMQCTDWAYSQCQPVELDLVYDLNKDGIVNFTDYAALMAGNVKMADIGAFSQEWLQTDWLYGLTTNNGGGGLPQ